MSLFARKHNCPMCCCLPDGPINVDIDEDIDKKIDEYFAKHPRPTTKMVRVSRIPIEAINAAIDVMYDLYHTSSYGRDKYKDIAVKLETWLKEVE